LRRLPGGEHEHSGGTPVNAGRRAESPRYGFVRSAGLGRAWVRGCRAGGGDTVVSDTDSQITDLAVNDHACLTFGDPEELLDLTAAFVRDGLSGGLKVVWLSEAGPGRAAAELARRGIAVETARMKGWKTRSYKEKSFFHHRPLGTADRGVLAASFSYGQKDYFLGGHPLWELFRVSYRMTKRPYLIDGVALGLGYGLAAVRRLKRPVSKELMAFHRREQMRKLRAIVKRVLTFKPIDKFTLLSD